MPFVGYSTVTAVFRSHANKSRREVCWNPLFHRPEIRIGSETRMSSSMLRRAKCSKASVTTSHRECAASMRNHGGPNMCVRVPGILYALAEGSVQTLPPRYTGSEGNDLHCDAATIRCADGAADRVSVHTACTIKSLLEGM